MTQHLAIIGAGAAGTLLAHTLVQQAVNDFAHIHIYDSAAHPGTHNGRWCLWARADSPLAGFFNYRRANMAYRDDWAGVQKSLYDYHYAEITWPGFFETMHDRLGEQANIHWHTGTPVTCRPGTNTAWCVDDGRTTQDFDYIFDARPPAARPMLYQHFTGWCVDMDEPVFNDDAVTLMDLHAAPADHVRFFYILPRSSQRALIEVTYLSTAPYHDTSCYEAALHNYLAARYPGTGYHIGAPCETGAIPLYARQPVRAVPGYIPIGLRGGAVRGATGYGFKHMHDHANAITHALRNGHEPPPIDCAIPPGIRWMDTIFMRVMLRQPQRATRILRSMFARLSGDQLARFMMCDHNGWRDLWRVIRAMPKWPFLRSVLWPF